MRSIKMGTALLFFSLLLSAGLTSDFICSEGTQKYCINISQHYCTHWEPIHALREVLQNWVDALRDRFPGKKIQVRRIAQESVGITNFYPVIEGTKNEDYYISYNRYEKKLVLVNEGAFKVENMLLGASTKMGNKRALGQFGEGMKLYLLVLLKHSHYVYIQSGDYYYGGVLEKWVYQYKDRVLFVHISPRTIKKDNTRVVIGNVTENLFTQFTYLSLLLTQNIHYVESSGKRLIFPSDKKLSNRLYKKSILIGMRFQLQSEYSYDFDQIELGRDRDAINDPQQLKKMTSQLHAYVLNNEEKLLLRGDISNKLEDHFEYVIKSTKQYKQSIKMMKNYLNDYSLNKIYRKFLEENKKDQLYPVQGSYDSNQIKKTLQLYGLDQNFYSTQKVEALYAQILKKNNNGKYYKTVSKKIQQTIKSQRELTSEEKKLFDPLNKNISALISQINNYRFKSAETNLIYCYRSKDKKTIFVNTYLMKQDLEMFKKKLIKLLLFDF